MTIGFIGLGNVGAKLAGSLLEAGKDLVVCDLEPPVVADFVSRGARAEASPKALAGDCEIVITCLPSPTICAEVAEGPDGILAGAAAGLLWIEMSTTDEVEVQRLGAQAAERGVMLAECPVSGGCHRAATGNISIFCGGSRAVFEAALPVLSILGQRILHTGALGSASVLKVVTNYLASVHLAATGEAFAVAAAAQLDMATTYEAIRISSGNSFSHETEGQLILNGSYDINFTMDLVKKDLGLFLDVAERGSVDLDIAPVTKQVFDEAEAMLGARASSPRVVNRLERQLGTEFRAPGFPDELVDTEARVAGYEVQR